MRNSILAVVVLCLCIACGTQKSGVSSTVHSTDPTVAYLQGVIDNGVDVTNIVGNGTLRLASGTQSVKLSTTLRMRRDEVIRLQLLLPIIGSEVGRIEFTPTSVLIIDRMNKQYIQADYAKVDFLRKNNITFYTLQSLFWNELVSPTAPRATYADTDAYATDITATTAHIPVTLTQGDTSYSWQTNKSDQLITSAVITHSGATGLSMLSWLYSNFVAVDNKLFPRTQEFSFTTMINGSNQQAQLTIDLDGVKTNGDWDAHTEVSSKYKKVPVETLLSRLLSL